MKSPAKRAADIRWRANHLDEARRRTRDRMRATRAREYRAAGRLPVKGEGKGRRYSPPVEVSEEELDRRAAERWRPEWVRV